MAPIAVAGGADQREEPDKRDATRRDGESRAFIPLPSGSTGRNPRRSTAVANFRTALAAVGWMLPLLAAAEPLRLEIDPARSGVELELGATLHTVRGTAVLKPGGCIDFDPETGQAAGRVVVDATSVDTGSARRDRTLHDEVLESERYPEIVFEARSLSVVERGEGTARFLLLGELAIHGGRHPVALEGEASGNAPGALRASAASVLPYVEWGLRDVSTFLLSVQPEVLVRVNVAGEVRAFRGSPGASGRTPRGR